MASSSHKLRQLDILDCWKVKKKSSTTSGLKTQLEVVTSEALASANSHSLASEQFRQFLTPLQSTENREMLQISFENAEGSHDSARHFRKKLEDNKSKQKEEGKKADVDISGSQWDVDQFCKYISHLKISYIYGDLPRSPHSETMDGILNDIDLAFARLAKVFKDDDNENALTQLSKMALSEQAVRSFIEALIIPILEKNRMILRMEENLNMCGLPTSKPDYTIYNQKGKILGCIETKASGKLLPKSVVQGILQLISLRTRAPNTLFNIITDAYQFIVVLYSRNGTFQLESNC